MYKSQTQELQKNNEILYRNSYSFIWNIYDDRFGNKDQVYKKKTLKREK